MPDTWAESPPDEVRQRIASLAEGTLEEIAFEEASKWETEYESTLVRSWLVNLDESILPRVLEFIPHDVEFLEKLVSWAQDEYDHKSERKALGKLVFSAGMREAVARLPELMISGRTVKGRFEAWQGIPWQNISYTLTEEPENQGVTLQELVITPEILTILRCLVENDSEALSSCSMPLIMQVQRFFNAGLQGFGSFNFVFA